ncbi:metal-sulfur cluster assembly factor [Lactobacillus selangorensis]|nr:metal-sulfur cluster assembly factor [Lactobacillus selangorensis]
MTKQAALTRKETITQGYTALKTVIDPEIGIDLVNLGLIYDLEPQVSGVCVVTMTLTVMGCPLTDYLYTQISEALLTVDEISRVEINLVWDPIWTIDRISDEAKMELGI